MITQKFWLQPELITSSQKSWLQRAAGLWEVVLTTEVRPIANSSFPL